MTDVNYLQYLQRRSLSGLLYRQFYLYPRLARRMRGKFVDIGCGIGDMLRFRPGTIGVDINPDIVAWCKAHGLDVRQMEPDKLPFGDASFDGAILDNVLEHLEEPGPLLDEAARILRPDGRLLVGVPGRKGYSCDPDHKHFYDEEALVATVSAHGFRIAELLHTPLRSSRLDQALNAYCVYGIFTRA